MNYLVLFLKEEKAQGLVEYSLIIMLIALFLIAYLFVFGNDLSTSLNNSKTAIFNAY